MGLGTSMVLIAVGAIMKFALNFNSPNVEIETVGVILMIVGAVGAALSLAFWSSWGGAGIRRNTRTTTTHDAGPPAGQDATIAPQRRVTEDEVREERY